MPVDQLPYTAWRLQVYQSCLATHLDRTLWSCSWLGWPRLTILTRNTLVSHDPKSSYSVLWNVPHIVWCLVSIVVDQYSTSKYLCSKHCTQVFHDKLSHKEANRSGYHLVFWPLPCAQLECTTRIILEATFGKQKNSNQYVQIGPMAWTS